MKSPLEWPLLHGIMPVAITILGVISAVFLAVKPSRRWFTRVVPFVVAIALSAMLLIRWWVDDIWHPFPEQLPYTVSSWAVAIIAGIAFAFVKSRSAGWRMRAASLGSVVLVTLTALVQVNSFFGYYPNLHDALGLRPANEVRLSGATYHGSLSYNSTADAPLEQTWQAAGKVPSAGRVVEVTIPGAQSHFHARPAWLYLPPAYFAANRPRLPVLVALSGQPGSPRDWLDGGQLQASMDGYAERHHGLTPVVVMPDDTGAFWANPMCMNSRIAQAETYLAVDVPNWIVHHLFVDTNSRFWAVAGASYGGTCAFQLAVRQPTVFPTFVDISGQDVQTLYNGLAATVEAAFGGNMREWAQVNPVDILRHHVRPHTWAMLEVGSNDPAFDVMMSNVKSACEHAKMHVRWLESPGGHSWEDWGHMFADSLDWLGARLGLTVS